jgi:hypothetical protein
MTMQIMVSVYKEEFSSRVHPAAEDRRAFVSVNVGDLHLMLDPEQAKRLAEVALQAAKEAGA